MNDHSSSINNRCIHFDPVFVVGYKRSGTTMFRLMLNQHPNLCIPSEWDCFQRFPGRYRNKNHQVDDIDSIIEALPPYYQNIFSESVTRELLASNLPGRNDVLIACLYQSCMAVMGKDMNSCRWGDKKPTNWPFMARLNKMYPNSQYIALVRDPRDTVASVLDYTEQGVNLTRFNLLYKLPLLPAHVLLAWHINYCYSEILRQQDSLGKNKLQIIKYEDLTAQPKDQLREVCSFLKLDDAFVDAMVNFDKVAGDPRFETQSVVRSVHSSETRKKVNVSRVGRYKRFLNEKQASDIGFICGNLCQTDFFDYTFDSDPVSKVRRLYLSVICMLLTMLWKLVRAIRILGGSL